MKMEATLRDGLLLSQMVPLISLLLIGLGCVYISKYYSTLNIEIFSYLTPSEIILSFLPKLLYISILSLAIVVSMFLPHLIEDRFNKIIEKSNLKFIKFILHIAALVIIVPIVSFYYIIIKIDNNIFQILISFLFISILYIYFSLTKTNLKWSLKQLYFLLDFGTIMTIRHADNQSKNTLYGNLDNFKLVANGKEYTSTDSLVFYGRITNYTFLYDKTNSKAIVLKNSDILEEHYK